MRLDKQLLEKFIQRTCSPRLQQKVRHFYLTRRVLKDLGPREPEMAALKFLVCPGDSVADIGANLGVYTKELSLLVGPTGRVYSAEPIRENYQVLESVTRKADLSNVRLFQAAIGSRAGQRQMVIPDLGNWIGYYQAHFSQVGDIGRFDTVEVLTLDELWRSNAISRLDFIKCDVEGAELDVLQGGLVLVEAQLPGWLMEVSRETSGKVFGILRRLGYRAFVYNRGLIQTQSYRDKEFSNYFFLHPNSKLWDRAAPYFSRDGS